MTIVYILDRDFTTLGVYETLELAKEYAHEYHLEEHDYVEDEDFEPIEWEQGDHKHMWVDSHDRWRIGATRYFKVQRE